MSKPARICIVGAESTGKTILAQNLAKHFDTEWVPEYGRDYTDEKIKNEGKDDLKFTQEDFLTIGKRQLEIEDEISAKCQKLVIIDSNLLTTCLWSEFLISICPPELSNLKVAREKTYDLYILPDINVPWVDDGVRLAEDTKWFHDRYGRSRVPYRAN